MKYWIRRTARILGITVFFIIFFLGIEYQDPFNVARLVMAAIRGVVGFSLFWLAGFIIADIVLKGIAEDIDIKTIEVTEEGFLQRVRDHKLNTKLEKASSAEITGETSP